MQGSGSWSYTALHMREQYALGSLLKVRRVVAENLVMMAARVL